MDHSIPNFKKTTAIIFRFKSFSNSFGYYDVELLFHRLENQCFSGLSTSECNEIVEKYEVDHFMKDFQDDITIDRLFKAMDTCNSLEEIIEEKFSTEVLEEMNNYEKNYIGRSHSSLILERVRVR